METIAAISTAPGIGGIGIIRISGEKAFDVVNRIFKTKENSEKEANTIIFGHIIDPKKDEIIDEVLVSFFRGPNSYTTEDVCEINSHGGQVVMNQILELCLENGATLAEPGEFTKRAFLNGRIDLSQAESVIDIIHAKTNKELIASEKQLQGGLSRRIQEIKSDIFNTLSNIEASIDYPEYDIEEVTNRDTINMLNTVKLKLEELKQTFEHGKLIKEGIKTAIIGRPNVGKSSLLNLLLKEDRAIVSQYEGTTRDTIEESIAIEGIPLQIIDTAGIRETENEIEKIGIDKAVKISKEADLIIAVFDGGERLTEEDKKILDIIKEKKAIIIINKLDLEQKVKEEELLQGQKDKKIIKMSALELVGLKELEDTIVDMFKLEEIQIESSIVVTNTRHKDLIKRAIEQVAKSKESIEANMPIDMVTIHIKEILECLNKITGESVSEDIIKEIFSRFCLGK